MPLHQLEAACALCCCMAARIGSIILPMAAFETALEKQPTLDLGFQDAVLLVSNAAQ